MKKTVPHEPTRTKRDTHKPCAICGWSAHMSIHLPMLTGPRKGLPMGHEYVPAPKKGQTP